MTFKIISGSYEDDPMLQQLIFEGVNEMVQSAHLPSDDLVMPVASDDIIIYAVDPKEDDIIGVLCYHIHLGGLRKLPCSTSNHPPDSRAWPGP